jgi:hypothetical protein
MSEFQRSDAAMTEHRKKRFFEDWIAAYGNRLDEVAAARKTAAANLQEEPLQEVHLSTSQAIDAAQKTPVRTAADKAAKTPINPAQQ